MLVKQERWNKLSSLSAPEPHEVVTKTGNGAVTESTDGVQLMSNNTDVKKYVEEIAGQDEKTPHPVDIVPTESAKEQETSKCPVLFRPTWVKKLPEKFTDFVMA